MFNEVVHTSAVDRLYFFDIEISGGPLDPNGTDLEAANKICSAYPDLVLGRLEGREWVRYSRPASDLQAATVHAMHELREFVPGVQMVGIKERSPSAPFARP